MFEAAQTQILPLPEGYTAFIWRACYFMLAMCLEPGCFCGCVTFHCVLCWRGMVLTVFVLLRSPRDDPWLLLVSHSVSLALAQNATRYISWASLPSLCFPGPFQVCFLWFDRLKPSKKGGTLAGWCSAGNDRSGRWE